MFNFLNLISGFILGIMTDIVKNVFQNKMNLLKEDRILDKWLINFEDYISQNNKYNIGPVITNTFVLNGIS